MSNQRKRILILCLVLVAGGGWIGLASRPASGERGSQDWMAGQSDPLLSDPNAPGETETGFGNTELFLKMMFSVVLVLALGAAAVYTSKKLLPRVARAQGREVRVRETTYLGPRKALHLVEVGEQRLLIGSTNESITTLAHLTEAWLDVAKPDVDGTVKV